MTIKTTIHFYRFNIDNTKEEEQYKALVKKLKATKGPTRFRRAATKGRGRWLNCIGNTKSKGREVSSEEIVLETSHLFNNQWNTQDERVFDWYEGIVPNENIKEGHYLDINQEMIDIRKNTLGCGYCGKQVLKETLKMYCDQCIDFKHLEEKNLFLLKLEPVSDTFTKRAECPVPERILQEYKDAQIGGKSQKGIARTMKVRNDLIEAYEKKATSNEVEFNGKMWFLDNGICIDNLIYYSHTGVFTFGWRNTMTWEESKKVLEVISEFNQPYCITGVDIEGKKKTWKGE